MSITGAVPPPPRVEEETGRGWNKRAPLSCRLGRLQRLTGGLYVCQAVWIVVSGSLDVTLDPAGFFCVVARRADSSSPLFSSPLLGGVSTGAGIIRLQLQRAAAPGNQLWEVSCEEKRLHAKKHWHQITASSGCSSGVSGAVWLDGCESVMEECR